MKRASRSRGFTIVELIVVIAILAVLATITVFGFSSWRTRTATTEVKNALKSVATAMENEKNFGTGFPASIPTTYTAQQGVTVTYSSGSASTFCVIGTSVAVPTVVYYMAEDYAEPKTTAC
jgi:prepilin-type N-terminal cleavage/methylation domain-containing protein